MTTTPEPTIADDEQPHHVAVLQVTALWDCRMGTCGPQHNQGCPTKPMTICQECSTAAGLATWPCRIEAAS